MATKPIFHEGFPCKKCDSYDTVGLVIPDSHEGDAWVTWCNCGTLWAGKGKETGKEVFNFRTAK